jgi:ferredoxin-NADP reductase
MNQMLSIGQAEPKLSTAIPLALTVTERRPVAEGIEEFTFASADGAPLPAWKPGAHVEFLLQIGGETTGRSYSLLGDPDNRARWHIAVLKQSQGRGGSAWMHDNAAPGSVLPAVGPRNAFAFLEAERYMFVAGGIGITPLLPMIADVSRRGKAWELVYLARHETRFAYASELRAIGGGEVHFMASAEPRFDLQARLDGLPAGTAVQACGPLPLLDALEAYAANASGRWRLSIERFAEPELGAGEHAFELQLARSGKTLSVPADRSVLDVLRDAGVSIEWSCRSGSCGTCECGVLEGAIDHRDQVLTPGERQQGKTMMVCVTEAIKGMGVN